MRASIVVPLLVAVVGMAALALACEGRVPRDDVDTRADAGVDAAPPCESLSVEECQIVGCTRLRAVLEDDHCRGTEPDVPVPLACAAVDAADACGDAATCAVDPASGVRWLFRGCAPTSWPPCELCSETELCPRQDRPTEACAAPNAQCDAFLVSFLTAHEELLARSSRCVRDEDCTEDAFRVACGPRFEPVLQGCSVAVARDALCSYREGVQDLEDELCPLACGETCIAPTSCAPTLRVACQAGRCTQVYFDDP